MNIFDTKILVCSKICENFIDIDFFQKYYKVDYFEDNIDVHHPHYFLKLFEKIKLGNYNFVILDPITNQADLLQKMNNFKKLTKNTKFVILDVLFPSVNRKKELEKEQRKNFITISDYKTNEFEDSIEVPLLGVLNQDTITQISFKGKSHLKYHQIVNYHDFKNRPFDVMFRVGKPKINRVLLSAMLLKNKLKNTYTNISFSTEPCAVNYNYNQDIFWDTIFHHSFPHDLEKYIKSIPIETNIGLSLSQTDIKYQSRNKNMGYTVDVSSCAEIYMESVTCEFDVMDVYHELVAYTEKTFNNFFYYKIPLAVDSKNNIDYLKNIGFQFPIEPCYIDGSDTTESLYEKLNDWFDIIKKYDFRKMWEDMFFGMPFDNPLHSNHLLYREFMQEKKSYRKSLFSKPQYLATYLFIEKYLTDGLDKFIEWDYQTYLFLKNKNLI